MPLPFPACAVIGAQSHQWRLREILPLHLFRFVSSRCHPTAVDSLRLVYFFLFASLFGCFTVNFCFIFAAHLLFESLSLCYCVVADLMSMVDLFSIELCLFSFCSKVNNGGCLSTTCFSINVSIMLSSSIHLQRCVLIVMPRIGSKVPGSRFQ